MATQNQIVQMVMTKMDELTPFPEGLVLITPPTAPLKPIEATIISLLPECVTDLLLSHPIHRLTPVSLLPNCEALPDGSGLLVLPSDFLRLVSFKIIGFERPVTEIITPMDQRYKLQYQEFTRGGKSKPTAIRERAMVLGNNADVLHYFSITPGDAHNAQFFFYINQENATQLKDELLDGLAWLCASKALTALGHIQEGQKALEFYTLFNARP